MGRKEKEPATLLAHRFCEVRKALGFKERKQFAEHLGIHASTLGTYETGLKEPTASALFKYQALGISLNWLATG
uniref:helix-turn-helix domain-containing protein n=1 Tax=Bartonella queenslandensis TaxID=481138 RepID=UPI0005848A0E